MPALNLAYLQILVEELLPIPFTVWGFEYHQELLELYSSLFDSVGVGRIDDIDQGIGVAEVIAPIFPQSFLPSDVPHVKLEFVVG